MHAAESTAAAAAARAALRTSRTAASSASAAAIAYAIPNASWTDATTRSSSRPASPGSPRSSAPRLSSACWRPSRGRSALTPLNRSGASASLSSGGRFASSTSDAPLSTAWSVRSPSRLETTGGRIARISTMPTWRASSPSAASVDVRSGSSSPAYAGSARPIPAPASTWGTTAQPISGAGRNASETAPPASSTAPAPARATAEPRTVDAISAAIGSTVTPAAAASGESAKPATSSSTSRNSTAVNAADVNASAAPVGDAKRAGAAVAATLSSGGAASPRAHSGPNASCDVTAGSAPILARQHPIAAAAHTGAWRAKIARQSNASVSAPPIAGPAAVPAKAAPSHSRRPCDEEPASRMSNAAIRPAAAPAAWIARNTSSGPSEPATAHPADAAAHTSSPPAPRRREPQHPPRPRRGGPVPAPQPLRRQDRRRQHERVYADDRGHAGDRRVHLRQDRRQRERDDRCVRERQRGRDRDERARSWARRLHAAERTRDRRPHVAVRVPDRVALPRALEMQQRELGHHALGARAPIGRLGVDLIHALGRRGQHFVDLLDTPLIELQRRPLDLARGPVEPAGVDRRGHVREDALQRLADDPAPRRPRQPRPVLLAEPPAGDRAVEVFQRTAPRLGAHELDHAEIREQPDVVRDTAQR